MKTAQARTNYGRKKVSSLKKHLFYSYLDVHEPLLLLANQHYIHEINFRGESSLKVHNLSNAVGLDYDYKSGCLYWTEVSKYVKYIRRRCPNDTDFEVTFFYNNTRKL